MAMKLAAAPKTLSIGRGVALVTLVRERTLSPEEAWKSGALDVDDLLYIVEERVDAWGGFNWQKDNGLRRALVGLLAQNGGERLKDTGKLSPAVRLWLADYYGSIGDERAVGLAESILGEMKPKVKGQEDLAFQAVERLGWFYRYKGQHEKSVQAWLRLEPLLSEPGWWLPGSLVEAARASSRAGEMAKASELYARVARYSGGWLAGLALWDQAQRLIGQGKYLQARDLLQNSVDKAQAPNEARQLMDTHGRDEGRTVVLSLLAYCYYRMNDHQEATRYAARATKLFESVEPSPNDDGLSDGVNLAYKVRTWCAQWAKQPIVCWPRAVTLALDDPVRRSQNVNLRTFDASELKVSCSDPRVKVILARTGKEDEWGYYYDRGLTISLEAPRALEPFEAVVTVSDSRDSSKRDVVRVQCGKQLPEAKP